VTLYCWRRAPAQRYLPIAPKPGSSRDGIDEPPALRDSAETMAGSLSILNPCGEANPERLTQSAAVTEASQDVFRARFELR
jgi:hypothetical protein